jgi:abortive infection bacteriophage resistance protein
MPVPYTKKWLSLSGQVKKLKEYGLVIRNDTAAELFLQHINYFRFSGYALAFEASRHVFIPGATFEQIRHAYEFDRALRDLVNESLEVIELDLRTAVAHTFSQTHGPFGHTLDSNFMPVFDHPKREYTHADWLEKLRAEVRRSRSLFIEHFKEHYQEYPDLPIWETTEIMSFGALARMYRGMLKEDQKRVSCRYGLQPGTLASWMLHLVYLRNLCAHHARLWDCLWAIKPDLPAGKIWELPLLPGNGRLFSTLLIQNTLLRQCLTEKNFVNNWRLRVERLITDLTPSAPDARLRMGLTADWTKHPLWS